MKKPSNHQLKGSYKQSAGNKKTQQLDKEAIIEVTVRLRRKQELLDEHMAGKHLSREDYENDFGASQDDADLVKAFAHEYQLETIEIDLARRSLILKGKISDFEEAFNVTLQGSGDFRTITGEIHVPDDLKDIISGVFGLDNQPIARAMVQVATTADGKFVSHVDAPQAFTPVEVAEIYGFPQGVTGKGQCIAIIELAGGFRQAELDNYFAWFGFDPLPIVKTILVGGGVNNPTDAKSLDTEVALDIEVAGAVAPGATLAVYFTDNNEQGFLNAVTTAIHDKVNKPTVLSISWGSAEVHWTPLLMDNFNEAFKTASALGITVCVGSGDTGSRDGETDGKVHVDFPASSPYALACGGTKLVVNSSQAITETVWHASNDAATGGGVSDYFPLPTYQKKAGVPLALETKFKGRGVPDIAGNADMTTGYKVFLDGAPMVMGGTSAVAPLYAGFIALYNEKNKKLAGFINPHIYANPGLFRDITEGDNKTTSNNTGYTAGQGWDACTGLGVLLGI